MYYFDNAATTKPSKSALDKAQKFNDELFYNPSAIYHFGLENNKEIKTCKDKILQALGVINGKYEVIFTSCGSESDNQAIFCSVKRGCFVTSLGEHSAVYQSFKELKQKNNTVYFAKLNKDGSVNVDDLIFYCKENKVDFVSIMHVNNETGAINDVNDIARKLKAINPKIIFHADGVQAFCKIPFRMSEYIDMYSISAHKINALKGVGALIKKRTINLSPLIFGGGQENGYRSGTENLFGIKVFEYAIEEHFNSIDKNYDYVKSLKSYLLDNLDKNLFTVISGEHSSPYILSVSAKSLKGEIITHSLEEFDIIIGNGSACSSKNPFSRVIKECGYSNEILGGVIRISFSKENTIEQVKYLTEKLNLITRNLKEKIL